MTEENTIEISAEVHAAANAAKANFLEERILVASQRYMDAMAVNKKINLENEELRASLALLSRPKPQDEENNALAELLRDFASEGDVTSSAIDSLVRDAKRVLASGKVVDAEDAN